MLDIRKFICFSLFLILSTALAHGQCNRNTRIAISGNSPSLELCAGDQANGSVVFSTSNNGTQYSFVVTDQDDNFISSGTRSRIQFGDFGPGTYRIYGMSYSGSLRRPVGQNIFIAKLSGGCSELSINYITIHIADLEGGVVTTSGGDQEVSLCVGDGVSDVLDFMTSSPDADYRYIITDDAGDILVILDSPMADFENAPEGKCRVYGLSGSGTFLAQLGDNIYDTELTDGCEELSQNYIAINRIRTDGGRVATSANATRVYVCPNNDSDDLISFINNSDATHNYQYIITDNNGIIIGVPGGAMVDFNDAPPGVCRVYGASYTGSIGVGVGDNINGSISSACYSLSSNYIEVIRAIPQAGSVRSIDNDTIVYTCPGDTIVDLVDIMVLGGSNSQLAYLITSYEDTIIGFADQLPLNFTGAPSGICHVYVVAYTGDLNREVGIHVNQASFSDDCYDLSDDYLEVIRTRPEGGNIETANGETAVELCVGDGIPDIVTISNSSQSLAPYRYVVTDENNVIVGLPGVDFVDFDRAGGGICRIWGVSFIGEFSGRIGDNLDLISLSDDCYELSDNFIEVTRLLIDAGEVLSDDGRSVIYTCPGDGIDDFISYHSTSNTNARLSYVITNENNSVLAIFSDTSINFENVGQGICRIWAIAYTGNIILSGGQDVTMADLASGCAALSTSFLEVHRSLPNAGSIATLNGETNVLICNGDGSEAIVFFEVADLSSADVRYIITDDQDYILDIITDTQMDFSNAPTGVCRIYGISFTGDLAWQRGDNINEVLPAEDCFDLSDNYIEVTRNGVDGGIVTTEDNMSRVSICPGNGISNLIGFITTSESPGNYGYIVTDINNNVLGLPSSNEVDFEGAGIGTCRLWGVSYSGTITIDVGDNIILDPITDGCYDLSTNFVTVSRDNPNWDSFSTRQGDVSVEVTVGDGIPSVVSFSRDGRTFGLSSLLITDADGNILGITSGNAVDFEGAGEGVCYVYGIAYTGNLLASEGLNINSDILSSDCYDLSDNPVVVTRSNRFDGPEGPSAYKFLDVKSDVSINYGQISKLLRIQLVDSNEQFGQIYIHSSQGELVWISDIDGYLELDMNDLNIRHGIFLITYRDNEFVKTKKIIITE